jgi:hypothetical protein
MALLVPPAMRIRDYEQRRAPSGYYTICKFHLMNTTAHLQIMNQSLLNSNFHVDPRVAMSRLLYH